MRSHVTLAFVALLAVTASAQEGAGTPRAGAAKRPNILFCIADDASGMHFSAYGCKFCNTPNFDRVGREGILFKNCFTPTPKCSPSRAAILTGRNPWQNEEACDHNGVFPAKFKVYPDLLEAAGYYVGFTGKGWGPGDFASGGFKRNPAGPQFSDLKNKPPTSGISPIDYTGNFAAFLDKKPKDKPFCFWYGGHEPHRKYEPGSGVRAGKKLEDVTVPPYLPDTDVVRSDILDYALEIEWFDTHLGRILKKLEQTGELDNTLVVVTSDNGMPFPRDKGHIYEDAFHMPLAVRWGNAIKGGRVLDDFVSFVDYAPTFLEAAGLQVHPQMTGHSLMNVLKSDVSSGQADPSRNHVVLGRERTDIGRPGDVGFPVRAIRTKDFMYAHNFKPDRWPSGNPETGYKDVDDSPTKRLVIELKDKEPRWWQLAFGMRGPEELYDLHKDPACVINLADDTNFKSVKEKLWNQLQNTLKQQQDPRILGNGDVFDQYKYVGNSAGSWENTAGGKKTDAAPTKGKGKKKKRQQEE